MNKGINIAKHEAKKQLKAAKKATCMPGKR
jgi:hypothetical protein